eukprot:1724291-Rhodomonas_salina.2
MYRARERAREKDRYSGPEREVGPEPASERHIGTERGAKNPKTDNTSQRKQTPNLRNGPAGESRGS